jgi:hypothetical protein
MLGDLVQHLDLSGLGAALGAAGDKEITSHINLPTTDTVGCLIDALSFFDLSRTCEIKISAALPPYRAMGLSSFSRKQRDCFYLD